MSVIFGRSTKFKELNLSVLTTLYEKAGDTDEHVLSNVGLTSETYDRRNHLLTGSFDVSYPGSDCPNDIYDSMGCIELSNSDYRHVDRFKIFKRCPGESGISCQRAAAKCVYTELFMPGRQRSVRLLSVPA